MNAIVFRIFCVWCMFVLVANFVHGQQSWESKDVTEWDKKDVATVLTDSPWSRSFTQGWNIGQILDGEVSATIVLRSALPVRIALLRQAQIEADYDELTPKARKEFDKKNAQLLSCAACTANYIVSLFSKDIHMSAAFVKDKKKFITLSNDRGDSIDLKGFATREKDSVTEVIFFFPRADAPAGFLTSNTSKIIFNMDFRVDDLRGFPVRRAEFDVKEITREGMIVF